MHRSKCLQHLLIKECDIINYTWVVRSEKPRGIALSAGEMLSTVVLKLQRQEKIQFSFWSNKTGVGGFFFFFFFTFCWPLLNCWIVLNLACSGGASWNVSKNQAVLGASWTCPALHLSSESPSLTHCLLVAVLHDQILIEVSRRAKTPHLNF